MNTKKCLVIATVGCALLGWLPASAMAGKLRIAVVDFGISDVTKEQSKQAAMSFREALAKNPNYEVLSREDVEQAFQVEDPVTKVRLAQYECINQEMACANQVGQRTGADKMLVGKIIKQKDTVIIFTKLIDARLRNVEFEASEEAPATADLNKLAANLAQKVDRWMPKAGDTKEAARDRRLKEEREDDAQKRAQIEEQHHQLAKRPAGTCPAGMVLIPAGEFTMGSDPADPDHGKSEPDNKKVMVEEFCIDTFEFPNKKGGAPMANVEWFAGKGECEKQGKRLCTEMEWEKACKGSQGLKFPYGGKYDPNKCSTPKDSKTPGKLAKSGDMADCKSGYGVYDMSGNLAEWTSSNFDPEYPQVYVMRGGSYKSEGRDNRCSARKGKIPFTKQQDAGFRCCK